MINYQLNNKNKKLIRILLYM